MKNLIFMIFVIVLVVATSCGSESGKKGKVATEDEKQISIGLKCFIGSDGKEYSVFRTGSFVNCPKGTTIVASVFQIGTDSVQIMYSSPEYGNGEYTWITSLSNYNTYETHRIRALVIEVKNASSEAVISQTDSIVAK